jgi:hypothetical protein
MHDCWVLLCAIVAFGGAAASAEDSWSQRAAGDLAAVRDLIRDNHPGPVDPENPEFRIWLDEGFSQAKVLAHSAHAQADYARALSLYINGFRDGHLSYRMTESVGKIWPGFLTATDGGGTMRVTYAGKNSPVPLGARLVSCDGTSAESLLRQKVHRFRTNASIPHEAILKAPFLFTAYADDDRLLRACLFEADGEPLAIDLSWRPIEREAFWNAFDAASQRVFPEFGLRQVHGVWFVSLPTFNLWNEDAAKIQKLIEQLEARAPDLHEAPYVVIDVRGNGGGNSDWGEKTAIALWGEAPVRAIEESFDWTTEWRTSAYNAELTRSAAKRSAEAGLAEDAAERFEIADALDAARARGEALYRISSPPAGSGLSADAESPFSGKVFFLTDMYCASACLDFADIMRRLPEVTHIGLPTSADAVYIDNVQAQLPSGAASFSWSLKVYRGRVRANNEWYDPQIIWPGGKMTDDAVATWVKTLDSAR